MQSAFPNVLPKQGHAFRVDGDDNIQGLGPDFVLAECIGKEGSPECPSVYCPDEGVFYQYNPATGLYEEHDDGALMGYIDSVLKQCAMECDPRHRDDVHNLRQTYRLRRICDALASTSRISVEEFRKDRTMLHLADGVLDLRTLELHSHSPHRPARWKLGVEWDVPSDLPRRFVSFLRSLFPRPCDRDLALSVMAMAVLGNPFQKVVFVRGPGGSGKSTFVKLMEELVGPRFCSQLNLPHAGERFQPLDWKDKLLLHQEEANSEMLARNGDRLKALSGKDRFAAEVKHRNERVQFIPEALPVLSSNQELRLPIDGDASAWERRLLVLDTSEACIPEDARVENLEKKLLAAEGAAIIRLVAARASRLLARLDANRGFPALAPPQVVRVHDLLTESDLFGYFVRQRVTRAPNSFLYAGELKSAFEAWLAHHDHPVPSRVQVTQRVKSLVAERGGTYAKSLPSHPEHSSRGWRGVTLT